ncbi:hypothetical protein EUX98_g8066 [Antrodiella citrinella]|uniref:Uncharacterized protein n=1 Tax=Antrodiella citrinella TaxID=2447956 RepID=A0A4S4MEM2_9APHY|nr:hypothetical protein EUX98_g8066 [Antrodiella citrinella]
MSASALLSPAAHSSVLDLPNSQSYAMEPIVKSLLTSTWHVLDQPPPPSLREILGAYKAKGDGDREMLISMLNAKSAEDQVRAPPPYFLTLASC